MQVIELIGATVVLLLTLGIGTIAHELSHAAVLSALGIAYDIEWFRGRDTVGLFGVGVVTNWASVTPKAYPQHRSPLGLRLSALAPLTLLMLPTLLLGVVHPASIDTNNLFLLAATVGWLACALPSPQDFSVFWHAASVIEQYSSE